MNNLQQDLIEKININKFKNKEVNVSIEIDFNI